MDRFDKIRHSKGDIKAGEVRKDMQNIMQKTANHLPRISHNFNTQPLAQNQPLRLLG